MCINTNFKFQYLNHNCYLLQNDRINYASNVLRAQCINQSRWFGSSDTGYNNLKEPPYNPYLNHKLSLYPPKNKTGETAVVASAYGPVECKLQNLQIEKSFVDVYYRSKSGLPSVSDRLKEQIINCTCETALLTMLHPRTTVAIQLQEMDDHAGLIACAINAACLALVNSGLPMKFLVAAVNCAIDADGECILDPDTKQEANCSAQLTFVFDSVHQNTVAIHTTGMYTIAQYNDALAMCQEASRCVFAFYRDVVAKFANKI